MLVIFFTIIYTRSPLYAAVFLPSDQTRDEYLKRRVVPVNNNPGLVAVTAQANVGLGVLPKKPRNVFVGEGRGLASKRFVIFSYLTFIDKLATTTGQRIVTRLLLNWNHRYVYRNNKAWMETLLGIDNNTGFSNTVIVLQRRADVFTVLLWYSLEFKISKTWVEKMQCVYK